MILTISIFGVTMICDIIFLVFLKIYLFVTEFQTTNYSYKYFYETVNSFNKSTEQLFL